MKTTFLAFSFWLLAIPAFAQGVRVGDSLPLQTTAVIQGTTVLTPIASGAIQFCNAPANAVPCTNKATTYTDRTLGTPCSTATQVVLAGTTTCVANSDANGNWGVWVASANYEWTFTNAAGASFGPFPVTANTSPSSNVWSNLSAPTGNLALAMGTNTTSFTWTSPPAGSMMFSLLPNPVGSGGLSVLGSGDVLLGSTALGAGIYGGSIDLIPPLISSPTPVQNKLVCLNNGQGGGAGLCPTSATAGLLLGVCSQNCSSGSPNVAIMGVSSCAFDNATNSGDWAIVSTIVAGDCHDTGSLTPPATSLSVVGRVFGTSVPAINQLVLLQISR